MANSTVYPFSFSFAKGNNEPELWRESHKQNILCANAVEKAIRDGFDGMRLKADAADPVIAEFGFPRVQWVLASTLKQLDYDGRFSTANKAWAKDFFIEPDMMNGVDMNRDLLISSHPAVLDGFVSLVRQAYQSQGLYDQNNCQPISGEDIKGKVAVLKLNTLKQQYQQAKFQLFAPDGGFGCSPTASGRRVYGTFLADGERASFYRQDFVGLLNQEQFPEWAREKLAQQTKLREAQTQEVYLCPLRVFWFPPGEDGYPVDAPEVLDIAGAAKYEDAVRAEIKAAALPEEAERGLMHWFKGSDAVQQKVTAVQPDVELVGDILYGAFICHLAGELAPEERTELTDFLTEQAETWGQHFEQQSVERLEGDLYFSFHSDDPSWSLRPEAEVLAEQNQSPIMGMSMTMS